MDRYLSGTDQLCENGQEFAICNWAKEEGQQLCYACSFNHIIPNLQQQSSIHLWEQLELAKRRALHGLLREGIRFQPWHATTHEPGLAFEFKSSWIEFVLTGYANGVITINLQEADDVERERMRTSMGEPYRTLLGHFRHELGHYFWDLTFRRLQANHPYLEAFQQIFGDLNLDYQDSLNQHYHHFPKGRSFDSTNFISHYASSHPCEDWAETWAHYWHILDAIETAESFGLNANESSLLDLNSLFSEEPEVALLDFNPQMQQEFLHCISTWMQFSPALNEMAGALGYRAIYPFALTPAVIRKLMFVHSLVSHHKKNLQK